MYGNNSIIPFIFRTSRAVRNVPDRQGEGGHIESRSIIVSATSCSVIISAGCMAANRTCVLNEKTVPLFGQRLIKYPSCKLTCKYCLLSTLILLCRQVSEGLEKIIHCKLVFVVPLYRNFPPGSSLQGSGERPIAKSASGGTPLKNSTKPC